MVKLESEGKHIRDMLNDRRDELQKAEDKMYKACSNQTYEATLAKVNSTVEKLQVCYKYSYIYCKFMVQLGLINN